MTVTIYGVDCKSTRKAKQWFQKNDLPFLERNITKEPLTVCELQNILHLTIDGTDEIVATRSKIYTDLNLDFDELSLKDLLMLIHENPKLLKSPIIADENRLLAGYKEESIRQFLPRNIRKTQWQNWWINHGLKLAKG